MSKDEVDNSDGKASLKRQKSPETTTDTQGNGSSRNLTPSRTTRDAFMNSSLAFSRDVSLGRLCCRWLQPFKLILSQTEGATKKNKQNNNNNKKTNRDYNK